VPLIHAVFNAYCFLLQTGDRGECALQPIQSSDESEGESGDLKVDSLSNDDQPTLTECIRFQGRERKINIPQEISIKYRDFGILLLDDRTGTRLEALEHEHRCNAELINSKILQEWIAGKGKHPVSWKTLTEVLRDVELNTLAEDIDHVKCS